MPRNTKDTAIRCSRDLAECTQGASKNESDRVREWLASSALSEVATCGVNCISQGEVGSGDIGYYQSQPLHDRNVFNRFYMRIGGII